MTRRWLVSGRVQGVGFRYFVARRAAALGLTGWTRNLPDGRVEVQASGTAGALDDLDAAIARGPSRAGVESLVREEVSVEQPLPKPFEIR